MLNMFCEAELRDLSTGEMKKEISFMRDRVSKVYSQEKGTYANSYILCPCLAVLMPMLKPLAHSIACAFIYAHAHAYAYVNAYTYAFNTFHCLVLCLLPQQCSAPHSLRL